MMDGWIVSHILRFIHPRISGKLSLICRLWRDMVRDERTWKMWLQVLISDRSLLNALILLKSDSTGTIQNNSHQTATQNGNILSIIKNKATSRHSSANNNNNTNNAEITYRDLVIDFLLRKKTIQFTSVVGKSFSFHNSYIVQETETPFLRCDKSYIMDIYLGGCVDGGEIGVNLRPNTKTMINFKYYWQGMVSATNIANNSFQTKHTWEQYSIIRCKVDSEALTISFYKNKELVCDPIAFKSFISSKFRYSRKSIAASCDCSFTLRWARKGIKILQCRAY